MANLQNYKIVLGSDNDYIYEDPILGSNGTAVVTKINGLIDAIELSSSSVEPASTGYLVTKDTANAISQLAPGTNKFCLISSTTSPKGLAYEERVDLYSSQSIAGNKSFTSPTLMAQLGVSGGVDIDGLLTTEDVVTKDLLVDGTLQVNQGTDLRSTLTVSSTTQLRGLLRVDNQATFEAPIVANGTLTVAQATALAGTLLVGGAASLNSNLSVQGTTNLVGTTTTSNNLIVGTSLLVNGSTSLIGNALLNSSLTVMGASLIDDNLTVTGTLTTNDLSIQDDVSIGNDLTVGGNTTVTGDLSTASSLTVGGISNLNGQVNAASNLLVGNDLTVNRDLSVGRNTNITGTLGVIGPTNLSILNTSGDISTLGDISAAQEISSGGNLNVAGLASIAGNLQVNGAANINQQLFSRSLVVDLGAQIGADLEVGGELLIAQDATFEGSLSIDQNLGVAGDISSTGDIGTTGSINATDLSLTGNALIAGDLGVDDITADRAVFNGDVNIQANLSLLTLSVSSNASFGGDIVSTGIVTATNIQGINTGDEEPASTTQAGIVKVDTNSSDPIVYLASSSDALFVRLDSKAQPNGVATLDSNGKVPNNQLPPLSISNVYPVGSEASMLALTAEIGDVAVRSDISANYILREEPASILSNWQELLGSSSSVASVHGRSGVVASMVGDYTASQISFVPNGDISSNQLQGAIEELNDAITVHNLATNNPHNTTAAQVGAIPTTDLGQPNGAASLDVNGLVPLSQLPTLSSSYYQDFQTSDLTAHQLLVTHSLGVTRVAGVIIWNNANKVIIPDDIEAIDNNTLLVSLNSYDNPMPIVGTWSVGVVK